MVDDSYYCGVRRESRVLRAQQRLSTSVVSAGKVIVVRCTGASSGKAFSCRAARFVALRTTSTVKSSEVPYLVYNLSKALVCSHTGNHSFLWHFQLPAQAVKLITGMDCMPCDSRGSNEAI